MFSGDQMEGNWRDTALARAEADERNRLSAISQREIEDDLRRGHFGKHFVIFDVISNRSSLQDVGWDLYEIILANRNLHYKFHAARALSHLLSEDGRPFDPSDVVSPDRGRVHRVLEDINCQLEAVTGKRRAGGVGNQKRGLLHSLLTILSR